jgi:two-component system sensor histidine kinase KdpD
VILREFDVDAALARHPDLLLVDELAHTNAPGCRHAKRWLDVAELLDAGIHVWTTLNVQHIESLNDVVGQITGVTVPETVPDQIFDLADDMELIDLPPEELLVRLREGKVYLATQAERALQNFFQKANLVALRELSLRQTAKRVHTEVETARREKASDRPWATTDRLLVCVGPSPTTARVIRTAKRVAAGLDAPWLAVSVERAPIAANARASQQIAEHFRLAQRLGAETITLTGSDVAKTILEYARENNVTKIFIGKTRTPRWGRFFQSGVVDALLEQSGEIDVYVIQGKEESTTRLPTIPLPTRTRWLNHVAALGFVLLATPMTFLLARWKFAEVNIVMVYLAIVAFVAFQLGRGPAILASLCSVLIFDIFFVPPYLSLSVDDTQYLFTFAVMMTIGVLISTLSARLHTQLERGALRERRTLALYRLGKQLSSLAGDIFLVNAAAQHLRDMTNGEVAVYLDRAKPEETTRLLEIVFGADTPLAAHPVSSPTAHWVATHNQIAGRGTDTLPNAIALFLPLTATSGTLGAVGVEVDPMHWLLQPDQRQWLENCVNQLALALERDRMAVHATDARIKAESEQVRSTLLTSVSHDLKTPLAAIAGASSTLLQLDPTIATTKRELLETISEEAIRLNGLLDNILQISRLDAGAITPNRQWHLLEDIVGSAIRRTRQALGQRHLNVDLPTELPLLHVDGLLLEQVFVNLLENVARYTPAETQVKIYAKCSNANLLISLADNGPGLVAGTQEKIFERFYRGTHKADAGRGSGLGLAICRAIVELHGGTMQAHNQANGGAEFLIRLPLKTPPECNMITLESPGERSQHGNEQSAGASD